MECDNCNLKYPDHLIAPFFSSKENIKSCCPICALSIRNEMHGLPEDTPFSGEMASANHEEALEFLVENTKP